LHGEKLEDFEIASHYKKEDEIVITGPRGLAFFADTAAFHKGTKVLSDVRAIFQINYATDNFGVQNKDVAEGVDGILTEINTIDPNYLESILEISSRI
jgi:hypothetical protein